MSHYLALYLRNHEAGASGGYDFFRRTAASHRKQPHGGAIRELADEVREDLLALRRLMRSQGVGRDLPLAVAARVGEKLGRLKPNGHLLRRSPLTDLVEIEGCLDAVHAKAAGWHALAALGDDSWIDAAEIQRLQERALSQIERLEDIHREVAARVL